MCLAKDPANRWQAAHDLAAQLKWIAEGVQLETPVSSAAPSGSGRRLAWIIAAIAIAAAGAAGVVLYMELAAMKAAPTADAPAETAPVVMTPKPVVAVDAAVEHVAAAEPNVEAKVEHVEEVDSTRETAAPKGEIIEPTVEKAPKKVEPKKTEKKIEKAEPKKIEKVEPTKKPEPVKAVEKPADKPVEKAIEKPVEKAVAQAPGSITIDSTPVYAVIYIDGKKYGETPLVNIKLAAGKHSVRAVSPSGSTKTATIAIEAGKTAPVKRIEW